MNTKTARKWAERQVQSESVPAECGCLNHIGGEITFCPLHEAAPELLEACRLQHKAIDILFARLAQADPSFYPSESGRPWAAVLAGNRAISKAEGGAK